MAEGLKLNPGEAVVKKSEKIGYGSRLSGGSNDLVLTNESLILVRKNLFGKVKDVIRFPVREIRVVNGQVQALLGKADNVTPTLDVYFASGQESFHFTWETDVEEWIDSRNELVMGQKPVRKNRDDWVTETLAFAESVAGTITRVKSALGIKETEQVSCSCPACGASLTGIRGDTTQCPYCGTFHTF